MPRIPDSSQLMSDAPRSRRGVTEDRSGEILGQTLVEVAERRRQADDRFAYSQARGVVLAADLEARKELENDADWATHEQRYRQRLEGAIGSVAKDIRSPADRALFEQDMRLDLERGTIAIRDQARRREVDVGRAGLQQQLTASREQALTTTDRGLRDSILQNVQDAIEGARAKGYVSDQEATAQRQAWVLDYADGFVDTLSPEEQVRHLSGAEAGSPALFLPADRRAIRLKSAQRELEALRREREAEDRARLAEARAAMTDRLRDMQVAASLGMPVDVPPRATMLALYGEQEGAQRYRTAERLAQLSGDVAELQHLPTGELIAKVESYSPTQVDGAAEQVQMQQVLVGSVNRIIEQRTKDPAGYLTQHSAVVRRAWDEMARDPTKAPQYLAAVRAEKERLGIDGREVLPQGYVAAVADEIAGLPAEGVADRIEEEAARWGKAWPQVYGQLAGKLPDTAAVIGSGIPKSAATALAATASLKPAELKAMLPPNVKPADVEEAIAGQFEEFVRSMPADAARTVTATLDAAQRLTIKYMADGMGRGPAAQRAFRDLVGSQYELRPLRGVTIRVPTGVGADAVEVGARRALEQFEADSTMVDVPPGAALTAEEYAGRMADAVRSRGYWMTSPDSSGLRLYLDGQPVFRAGGPVDLPWEELATEAAKVAPSEQATPYFMRHPYE